MADMTQPAVNTPNNKAPELKDTQKLKSSTVKDAITKGRTMTGSKPDNINMNPIQEAAEKTAVMAYGRFNPPTTGHEKLIHKVESVAAEHGGTAHIIASHSEGNSKNPLPTEKKLGYLKKIASKDTHVSSSSKEAPSFLQQAKKLHDAGHNHLVMVAGSDRVDEYNKKLNQYNGKEGHYNFKSIKVVSAGHRDPDAEGTEGMSGTKVREHARAGNMKEMKKGLPKALHPHAEEIAKHIQSVKEDFDINELFESQLDEKLSVQQRMRKAFTMRRYEPKLMLARKRAIMRRAGTKVITRRARKLAINTIKTKLAGGRDPNALSAQEKSRIEDIMARRRGAVRRLTLRLIPKVRKKEAARFHKEDIESNDIDFLNALYEMVQEDLHEGKRGLWDNIHAKRKRIEAGSGEHMRRAGEEGRPSAADFKRAAEETDIDLAFEGWVMLGTPGSKSPFDHAGDKRPGYRTFTTDKSKFYKKKNTKLGDTQQSSPSPAEKKSRFDESNNVGSGAIRGLGTVTGEPNGITSYAVANSVEADTKDSELRAHKKKMHDNLHTEEVDLTEVSAELVGKVNKARMEKPSKTPEAAKTLSNAVKKAWLNSKVGVRKEEVDKTKPTNREIGTDSLVQIYKKDTPGQNVDNKFQEAFKATDREAMMRSGQDRKKEDLVPRSGQDRKQSTAPYRQQEIQKKIIDEAVKPADKDSKGPFAIATKTRSGSLKRVPDTRFDTYDSAHKYGMQYHTDKYGSQMFHVVHHPDAKKRMDEEQLDEISRNSARNYYYAARGDLEDRASRINRIEEIPTRSKKDAEDTAKDLKHLNTVQNKRIKGMELARKRLKKEEVEQIDEISTKTKLDYIRSAASATATHAMHKGMDIATRKPGEGQSKSEVDTTRKLMNRQSGIQRAARMLSKEDVDHREMYRKAYKEDLPSMLKDLKSKKKNHPDMRREYGSSWKMLNQHAYNMHGSKYTNKHLIDIAQKHMNEEVEQIDELSAHTLQSYTSAAIRSNPNTVTSKHPTGKTLQRKKAINLAMDKLKPKTAIRQPKVVASEELDNKDENI